MRILARILGTSSNLSRASRTLLKNNSIDDEKIKEVIANVRDYLIKNYSNYIKIGLTEVEIKRLESLIVEYLRNNPPHIENISYNRLAKIVREKIVGFGILEEITQDKSVYEIHVKGTQPILVKKFREGKCILNDKKFSTDDEVYQMSLKLLSYDDLNGQLSWANPEIESYIGEWRISATIRGYSQCNTIVLRRQVVDITPKKLIELGTANDEMIDFLCRAVKGGLRIGIAGLPDSGKTGTMIALAHMLDYDHIIITVEDTKELYIEKFRPHVTSYIVTSKDQELRQRNITASLAIKNSLNQGVETLFLGQIRKNIAYASLESMLSGLQTIFSIHSVSPDDLIIRYDSVLQYEIYKPEGFKKDIAQAVDLILYQRRMKDNSVKMDIYELSNSGELKPLFIYKVEVNTKEKVKGEIIKYEISEELDNLLNERGF